jgi:hypothetical protein
LVTVFEHRSESLQLTTTLLSKRAASQIWVSAIKIEGMNNDDEDDEHYGCFFPGNAMGLNRQQRWGEKVVSRPSWNTTVMPLSLRELAFWGSLRTTKSCKIDVCLVVVLMYQQGGVGDHSLSSSSRAKIVYQTG